MAASEGVNNSKNFPGKLTRYVWMVCMAAATGNLLFGYDNGISGGVTSMAPFLQKFFPKVYYQEALDKSVNQYCKFDSVPLTMFTSSLYLAALVTSLFGASLVTRKFGRRLSLLIGGVAFSAGSILNGAAQNIAMLIVGRLFLGFGLGFSLQSAPLYIAETAPHKYRALLNLGTQVCCLGGVLGANVLNYFTSQRKDGQGWRISLGLALIPSLVVTVSAIFLPDTPNSMVERGKLKEARATLCRVRGLDDRDVEDEFNDLVRASEESNQVKHPWRTIMKRKYRPHLTMALLLPTFQQLTGINVVVFYAPELFKTIGFGDTSALSSSLIVGSVNFLGTVVFVLAADRLGRRPLFLIGGTIMGVMEFLVAILIGWKFGVSGNVAVLEKWYAIVVVFCICLYSMSFVYSWGGLAWLVASEVFPLEIRSAAQSINVSMNMIFTFFVAQTFLKMLCVMKFGLFLFFAFFLALMTGFVYFFLPETKNVPIEEMWCVWEKHWYWRRFVVEEHTISGKA